MVANGTPLFRLVFAVGVLDKDEFPGGFLHAAPDGGALARVDGLQEDADARVGEPGEDVARPVGRPVVDDDQLALERGPEVDAEHARHDGPDGAGLVVGGHDDRQFHAGDGGAIIPKAE